MMGVIHIMTSFVIFCRHWQRTEGRVAQRQQKAAPGGQQEE